MQRTTHDRLIDPRRISKENRTFRLHQTSLVMVALVLATVLAGVAGLETLAA